MAAALIDADRIRQALLPDGLLEESQWGLLVATGGEKEEGRTMLLN